MILGWCLTQALSRLPLGEIGCYHGSDSSCLDTSNRTREQQESAFPPFRFFLLLSHTRTHTHTLTNSVPETEGLVRVQYNSRLFRLLVTDSCKNFPVFRTDTHTSARYFLLWFAHSLAPTHVLLRAFLLFHALSLSLSLSLSCSLALTHTHTSHDTASSRMSQRRLDGDDTRTTGQQHGLLGCNVRKHRTPSPLAGWS